MVVSHLLLVGWVLGLVASQEVTSRHGHLRASYEPVPTTRFSSHVWSQDNWKRILPPTRVFQDLSRHNATRLHLDKHQLQPGRESLTVSWENANALDSVLALYCGSLSSSTPWELMGATTVDPTKASLPSQKRRTQSLTSYYIHKFPRQDESDCQLVLYTQDDLVEAAVSELFRPLNSKAATNLHLALTDQADTMLIQFATESTGTPVAMYGESVPATKVEGTTTTYTAADLCSAPANITTEPGYFLDPGQLHSVAMPNLKANTRYQYKVGIAYGQGVYWSDTFEFLSPPAVGPTADQLAPAYSYLVYGDQGCPTVGWGMGGYWTAQAAAREATTTWSSNGTTLLGAQAVHHVGDLSYARGAAHIWDEWLSMVQTFSTRIPLMIAVGNHEYDYLSGGLHKDPSGDWNQTSSYQPIWGNYANDSAGECGVPVSKRFQMPPTGNGVFWYSYNVATVHTTVVSTEHDLSSTSPQYQWLEQDLQSINRTLTPWVVLEMHRPIYMNEAKWEDNNVSLGIRSEIETLLQAHNVDLVFSGHYHSYFRSCSGLFQSQCDNGGPTYITVGSAGAKLDHVNLYRTSWAARNIQDTFGYGKVTVPNSTALQFQFVQAGPEDDNATGVVLDEIWLTKLS